MNQKKAIVVFIAGIIIIILSPFISGVLMQTIYQNEPNFLDLRFSGFTSALHTSGGLISIFGIVAYFCKNWKKGK